MSRLPRLSLLLVTLAAVAAVPAGAPVDRPGQPLNGMVTVPRGAYTVGLNDAEMLEASAECEASTDATLCFAYAAVLAQMTVRTVVLSTYEIDRYEVTRGQYQACVAMGHCSARPMWLPVPPAWGANHPMTYVNWFDAQAYCQAQHKRLPTEAEWEVAARGRGAYRWPWGMAADGARFNHGAFLRGAEAAMLGPDNNVNVTSATDARDGAVGMAPVGSFPFGRGPFGTYDQAGNAAEWTFDSWAEEGYGGLSSINPRRDTGRGGTRVIRGGSWVQPEYLGQANVRDPHNVLTIYDAQQARADVGFRCARGAL